MMLVCMMLCMMLCIVVLHECAMMLYDATYMFRFCVLCFMILPVTHVAGLCLPTCTTNPANGICYWHGGSSQGSFRQVLQYCRQDGGTLVIMDSKDTWDWLRANIYDDEL